MPRAPYMIVAMIVGSVFGCLLPFSWRSDPGRRRRLRRFPPLSVPSFDPATWRTLAPAALALTVLGLTEAVSIARAVALKTGQRIDGNQEFIGQGMSNLAGAFSPRIPRPSSFNRSGVNLQAGAQTPLAADRRGLCWCWCVLVASDRWRRGCRSP